MPYCYPNTTDRELVPGRPPCRRVRLAAWAGAAIIVLAASGVAAQSEGGPRLGGQSEPSLDFGTGEGEPPTPSNPPPAPAADPAPEAPAAGAQSVEPEITKHRDWDVACAPAGGNCIMTQEGNDANGNAALRIMIERLDEPQEVEDQVVVAVIDIVTPLGVVLNTGLSFQIDESPTSRAPFQICTVEGCLVREPVTQDVIDRMRRGNAANIGFVVANYGEVDSQLSLSGFTSAYGSLE